MIIFRYNLQPKYLRFFFTQLLLYKKKANANPDFFLYKSIIIFF